MTSNVSSAPNNVFPSSGERSRLLPFNRRLRHLQGITFRNLNLDPSAGRERGSTIDDEALPYALKTPVKVLAEKERKSLVHSRSFDHLKQAQDAPDQWSDDKERTSATGTTPASRPLLPQQSRRRKSTLEWSNASPAERQDTLRKAISRRTADVFFSLHVRSSEEPIYVSEVVEDSTNPNFRAFDLRTCFGAVSRQEDITVRIWALSEGSWRLLVQQYAVLRDLQFIARSLETLHQPLPDNALIFNLSDGYYAASSSSTTSSDAVPNMFLDKDAILKHAESTSSYDALKRLATLDECVQDALAMRDKLTSDINTLIDRNHEMYFAKDTLSQDDDKLSLMQKTVSSERRVVKASKARLEQQRSDLATRRQAISISRSASKQSSEDLSAAQPQLEGFREAHAYIKEEVGLEKRRICFDLGEIYPIEPIHKRPLAFTIRGLPLPNADFTNVSEDATSAALGCVAHMLCLLSLYLSVALPYPILPSSSTSTIQDPISNMTGSRIFPLYMPRAIFYRFEYGVFLLNKDIEVIANIFGLSLIDIRQTLPNLKYVLFVATAGKGELPARKASGVRGLLASKLEKDTPDSSRRSSFDNNNKIHNSLREQIHPDARAQNGSAKKPPNLHPPP